jgi:hypothetical protein
MSVQSAFSSGKAALRRGAFGVAMTASLFGANAAQASDFTQKECGNIFEVSSTVIGVIGANTLSALLPQSLASFIAPSNPDPVKKIIVDGNFDEIAASKSDTDMALKRTLIPTLTCDGPRDIVTPTDNDVDTFNTIRGNLLVREHPIDLWAHKIRSVAGPVASASLN